MEEFKIINTRQEIHTSLKTLEGLLMISAVLYPLKKGKENKVMLKIINFHETPH